MIIEGFILANVSPQHLVSRSIATGGDTASHYYTLHYLFYELLPQLKISGWTPGNYAGFPILQFYFPLPFLIMCALGTVLPLAVSFKWITLLGVFMLPVAVYILLRSMRSTFPTPVIGAALTLPFLFNEANSMWGGNLLSTLAGEFSYSLSLALSFILLGSLYRGCLDNRRVLLNSFLVFLVGFSHGYTLLFVGAASIYLLITPLDFFKRLVYLIKVYALGFLLLAFWLIPLLVFSPYTIAFHPAWQIYSIKEIIPPVLFPVVFLAGIGFVGIITYLIIARSPEIKSTSHALGFLCFGIGVAAVMFAAAPRLGVVDIRYIPYAQLMACLIGALGLGYAGAKLGTWRLTEVFMLIVIGSTLVWTYSHVEKVPEWSKWNNEGFEGKAAWPLFKDINHSLRGTFQDPRVAVEHATRHNMFGSMRAFESLPFFAGRATLEGVYLQASLSAPFVFYIQSEISKQKSSPFYLYTYTDMDFKRAKRHLKMFNVKELILVSDEAKTAIRKTPGYRLKNRHGDYEIWELPGHNYPYVVPLKYEPIRFLTSDWKMDAYSWFQRDDLNDVHLSFAVPLSSENHPFKLTVTSFDEIEKIPVDTDSCQVKEKVSNEEIVIETDCIDKPLLVKMSYHPNWYVQGADRIFPVSPSFMLIYPKEKNVRLYYGPGVPERIGFVLSCLGVFIFLLHVPLSRKQNKTLLSIAAKHIEIPSFYESHTRWNIDLKIRHRLLICITIIAGLIVAAMSYHIYRSEPARVFNRAVKLRDDRHFDEAREDFNHVLKQIPSSSLALESAYYIASTHYIEGKYPAAISAFERLIKKFPNGKRNQEALYHIGVCLLRMGDKKQGMDRLKHLIAQHPGNIWANYARDRIDENELK